MEEKNSTPFTGRVCRASVVGGDWDTEGPVLVRVTPLRPLITPFNMINNPTHIKPPSVNNISMDTCSNLDVCLSLYSK